MPLHSPSRVSLKELKVPKLDCRSSILAANDPALFIKPPPACSTAGDYEIWWLIWIYHHKYPRNPRDLQSTNQCDLQITSTDINKGSPRLGRCWPDLFAGRLRGKVLDGLRKGIRNQDLDTEKYPGKVVYVYYCLFTMIYNGFLAFPL